MGGDGAGNRGLIARAGPLSLTDPASGSLVPLLTSSPGSMLIDVSEVATQRPDPNADDDRWHTIGLIGNVVVIVAHTWPSAERGNGVEVGRIISARKATTHERRAYEEGDF